MPARHPHALSRPEREELGAALLGRRGAQRPRQRVLQRERQDELMSPPARLDLPHEAVDDAARRTAREGPRDARLVLVRVEDRLLVGVGDAGLVAGQERRAQLRGGGAERQRPPRCRGRP